MRSGTEGGDQLARRLVALAAHAEAAMDDLFQMIAARETPHIAAAHRTHDVAAQKHGRDQADLINVVSLLPASHPSPGYFSRRVENVERVRGDAPRASLVHRDAEVAKLQLLVLANEDVERCKITMHRLPAVQNVERTENRRDLTPHEPLGLRALTLQPHPEVAMRRVLQCHAITRASAIDFHEPVEHSERPRLAEQQLGEVGLAEPARKSLGDLDANLGRQPVLRYWRRQINFAESTLSNQPIKLICATTLRAEGLCHGSGSRHSALFRFHKPNFTSKLGRWPRRKR